MNIIKFIQIAYEHRINLCGKKFIGVFLMLIGWLLISYGITSHKLPENTWIEVFFDYGMQMFAATLTLLFVAMIYGLIKNHTMKGYQIIKITKENEVIQAGSINLSYPWRIIGIYLRAFFAISGYLFFEYAKSFMVAIDNSVLHGADALAYALLFGTWLEKKGKGLKAYNKWEWTGMIISSSALLFIFIYEFSITNLSTVLDGIISGFGSSIALAIIILLSGILVYHDSVIRISFHNCFFGFMSSFVIVCIIMTYHVYHNMWSDISDVFYIINYTKAIYVGIAYALALLCFLQAYKFIEPVFIAILGNSLGIWTILISKFLIKENLHYKDIIITFLLMTGSIVLGIQAWKKDKYEKTI